MLTPIDILDIFIEQHRLCSPIDPEADEFAVLGFETTIAEWRDADDLIAWRPLSEYFNKQFNIAVSQAEWEAVLTPSHKKTLRGVCELISAHAVIDDVKPIKLLGQECLSSAMFLTLKKYLKHQGVDVSDLRPSSSVTFYIDNYFSPILDQITIMSKGRTVFEKLELKREKRGLFNYFNIFNKDKYSILTGDIITFRDLTLKMIEANRSTSIS